MRIYDPNAWNKLDANSYASGEMLYSALGRDRSEQVTETVLLVTKTTNNDKEVNPELMKAMEKYKAEECRTEIVPEIILLDQPSET